MLTGCGAGKQGQPVIYGGSEEMRGGVGLDFVAASGHEGSLGFGVRESGSRRFPGLGSQAGAWEPANCKLGSVEGVTVEVMLPPTDLFTPAHYSAHTKSMQHGF